MHLISCVANVQPRFWLFFARIPLFVATQAPRHVAKMQPRDIVAPVPTKLFYDWRTSGGCERRIVTVWCPRTRAFSSLMRTVHRVDGCAIEYRGDDSSAASRIARLFSSGCILDWKGVRVSCILEWWSILATVAIDKYNGISLGYNYIESAVDRFSIELCNNFRWDIEDTIWN